MAEEFEWQTEVDSGWEASPPEPVKPRRRISRRVKLIILLVVLCIVSGAGVWIYTSLNRRVTEAADTAESGALLAHALLMDSALAGDSDVVESLVANRPSSWHALNNDLLARQLFFSRRPLGIEVDRRAEKTSDTSRTLVLSPEMTAAEVTERRPYTVQRTPGISETILLERTFFYEQTAGQWQLAPVADERAYWGNWLKDERENVTLTFPTLDQEFAVRLARYLEDFLPGLCAAEGVNCPEDFHLEFKLETDPNSVSRLGEGTFAIRASSEVAGGRLGLPAPGLIGSPIDETGYRALERGYASWIGASIVAGYGIPETASGPELVAKVLDDFGLQPPATPVRPLPGPALSTFPAGAPEPTQDLLMLCEEQSTIRLLRFTAGNGRWQEEVQSKVWQEAGGEPGVTRSYLSRLPDYHGAMIQRSNESTSELTWRSYLWRDGVMRFLTEDSRTHYYLPPSQQPPNQPADHYLAFFVPGNDDGSQQFSAFGVDLDSCDGAPCALETLPGMPLWSPGGGSTVVIVAESDGSNTLHIGDDRGHVIEVFGQGQSVAWLDENRFIYVSLEAESEGDFLGRRFGQQALKATLEDGESSRLGISLLFDAEMVREAIPASIRPESLALWTVQPALGGDTWWFVGATAAGDADPEDYVLVYNSSTGEARVAAGLDRYRLVYTPMVSPSGRFAVIGGLSLDGSEINAELIDAQTGEMSRLYRRFPVDWSSDDEWLLLMEGRSLFLVSTSTGLLWPIQHDLQGCYWTVWTERKD